MKGGQLADIPLIASLPHLVCTERGATVPEPDYTGQLKERNSREQAGKGEQEASPVCKVEGQLREPWHQSWPSRQLLPAQGHAHLGLHQAGHTVLLPAREVGFSSRLS